MRLITTHPKPPTVEIAIDIGAACASLIALVLEYQKTCQPPDMEPRWKADSQQPS